MNSVILISLIIGVSALLYITVRSTIEEIKILLVQTYGKTFQNKMMDSLANMLRTSEFLIAPYSMIILWGSIAFLYKIPSLHFLSINFYLFILLNLSFYNQIFTKRARVILVALEYAFFWLLMSPILQQFHRIEQSFTSFILLTVGFLCIQGYCYLGQSIQHFNLLCSAVVFTLLAALSLLAGDTGILLLMLAACTVLITRIITLFRTGTPPSSEESNLSDVSSMFFGASIVLFASVVVSPGRATALVIGSVASCLFLTTGYRYLVSNTKATPIKRLKRRIDLLQERKK